MDDNFAKEFQHEMVFIHGLYGQNGQYRGLIKALEKKVYASIPLPCEAILPNDYLFGSRHPRC